MAQRTPQIYKLFQYVCAGLALIAAVEYFKYSTRINYEWFHCTLVEEPWEQGSSLSRLYAVGGPSCDKRGELKTIMKKITRGFDLQKEGISFCIKEDLEVPSVHYPIHDKKGAPGYVAYASYDSDSRDIREVCEDAPVLHI
ncbi:sphingosine N-acyltransferase subunit LIP1 [Lachancea thermotolerans CBS 6340]|uniref:KLTH0B09350p n=1 Tax=Lachancea thermotolerans (strain ATCC 56472 / CBS 6340 / NRRL Y-8284) TaxID=559295 RepID=C5DD94_LACTC|nr:KLTH0B09350p [Lachancea thermotolerans CBS 6340]CAR21755.1 KLTH0B09350p [Lachancea thermotolerans CBS 6340]